MTENGEYLPILVKIKKLNENAVIPEYAKDGDAGLDLTAIEYYWSEDDCYTYHTGLSIEIPNGYVGLLFPRSSIYKKDLALTNCVGVIDSGYRGEIIAKFKRTKQIMPKTYAIGDRVVQLIILPYPKIELIVSEELSESERGSDGFGSTDVKVEETEMFFEAETDDKEDLNLDSNVVNDE